jgi:hypothetical protein
MYASYTHIFRPDCTSIFWQLVVTILKVYYFLFRFNAFRYKEKKDFQAVCITELILLFHPCDKLRTITSYFLHVMYVNIGLKISIISK